MGVPAVEKLLQVKNLNVDFVSGGAYVRAVSELSFDVGRDEAVGIVGESGSGKSVTSLSIMGLLPRRGCRVSGSILFQDKDLLTLGEREMEQVRGNQIAMIFQEPMTSLNPVHTCGAQIAESILLHTDMKRKQAEQRALELLELCGIPDPKQRFKEYPHQLSGGMRQRIMIAIALACDPALLLADEPTTALDVTIQAQILRLMKELRQKKHMSVIMITHDLGVVSEFCDRVVVVYCGEAVEMAPVDQLFRAPCHPYTEGLINAIPRLGQVGGKLEAIDGMVPDLDAMPKGCRFHPRCKYATERCRAEHPELTTLENGRCVRCFLREKGGEG